METGITIWKRVSPFPYGNPKAKQSPRVLYIIRSSLLLTLINNDNLFYLSLAATLLPLPLRIRCRSACCRVTAALPC